VAFNAIRKGPFQEFIIDHMTNFTSVPYCTGETHKSRKAGMPFIWRDGMRRSSPLINGGLGLFKPGPPFLFGYSLVHPQFN